jgi:hypothetical protein
MNESFMVFFNSWPYKSCIVVKIENLARGLVTHASCVFLPRPFNFHFDFMKSLPHRLCCRTPLGNNYSNMGSSGRNLLFPPWNYVSFVHCVMLHKTTIIGSNVSKNRHFWAKLSTAKNRPWITSVGHLKDVLFMFRL